MNNNIKFLKHIAYGYFRLCFFIGRQTEYVLIPVRFAEKVSVFRQVTVERSFHFPFASKAAYTEPGASLTTS